MQAGERRRMKLALIEQAWSERLGRHVGRGDAGEGAT